MLLHGMNYGYIPKMYLVNPNISDMCDGGIRLFRDRACLFPSLSYPRY